MVLSAEDTAYDFGVHSAIPTGEVAQTPIDLRLLKNGSREPAILIELGYGRFTKGGQFVQKAIAINATGNHHAAPNTQGLKHARNRFTQPRLRHSNELRRRSRRIQQRSEEIEDGALPTFRAELARGGDVLEGRVIFWREEKRELMFAQRLRALFGSEID